METMKLTARNDGWVKGKLQNITFTALVFDEPSEFGIEGGKISKLFIYQDEDNIASYERGWLKAVPEPMMPFFHRIKITLENLPSVQPRNNESWFR